MKGGDQRAIIFRETLLESRFLPGDGKNLVVKIGIESGPRSADCTYELPPPGASSPLGGEMPTGGEGDQGGSENPTKGESEYSPPPLVSGLGAASTLRASVCEALFVAGIPTPGVGLVLVTAAAGECEECDAEDGEER